MIPGPKSPPIELTPLWQRILEQIARRYTKPFYDVAFVKPLVMDVRIEPALGVGFPAL